MADPLASSAERCTSLPCLDDELLSEQSDLEECSNFTDGDVAEVESAEVPPWQLCSDHGFWVLAIEAVVGR